MISQSWLRGRDDNACSSHAKFGFNRLIDFCQVSRFPKSPELRRVEKPLLQGLVKRKVRLRLRLRRWRAVGVLHHIHPGTSFNPNIHDDRFTVNAATVHPLDLFPHSCQIP
ncbi:hypothetical protein VTO42DRAFT_5047 [Malbranchea cinnamomea]